MAGGGPVGQVASHINSSNPLGPQQGQSTPPTAGQQQQPLSIDDYYKTPQLRQSVAFKPGEREAEYQQYRDSFGQQPNNSMVAQSFGDMQYRPQLGQQPFGGQLGQLRQNPFQPQQPAFMQSPEYQGYQTQMQGLQQQMNDYMQKAPMYQQLQDLQGKMQGYHDNYARQQQQQMMQRPSPFRRGQFQQPMGLMGLMGGRGGMPQPRMSMDMPQYQRAMTMDMPQARGFESNYMAFMKNGGKV
jgi:hypothetical protein